ncbi:10903_t:CDS:2 [Funneliformis geosporum]|uniref:10903_t:CDS:1 n=1 Tax=Funneliformis geosporum TaxID=1117311 RepID=A0A9W4T3L4_9GLOM|nr:10903_t:CDS:2 [Funneliformis geosporum]
MRKALLSHDFSLHDQYNIAKFAGKCQKKLHCNQNIIVKHNQEHAVNYANQCQELQCFDFNQELISYKCKVEERIQTNAFYPSFAKLISDFDAIIKYQSCSTFLKKTATETILLASKQIFGFDQLREGQLEAVETYLRGITIVISPLKALMEDQKRKTEMSNAKFLKKLLLDL